METVYAETESLAPLPDVVVLRQQDDLEKTVESLETLYEAHFTQWVQEDRERWFKRETRFSDEEDGAPVFPVIMRTLERNPNPRFLTIPNGRRVMRLDPRRVLTLCGTREVMTLEDAIAQRSPRGRKQQCRSCYGWHLLPQETSCTPPSELPHETRVLCPKCTTDAEASYFLDGYGIVCRICGHRVEQPLPLLSEEEEAQNAWAVESATVVDRDDLSEENEDEQDWDRIFDEAQEETHDVSLVDGEDINTLPASWMLDVDLDALTAEDLHELGDCLHQPAFQLFTTRSALRQGLINSALVESDDPASRMMRWAAAGRLLSEAHTRFDWQEGQALAGWLQQLGQDDLSLLAGDCNASHPWLIHPEADMFEPTDRLLHPLRRRILQGFKRFRNANAAVRYLSRDFKLSPIAIRHLVTETPQDLPQPCSSQAA